MPVSYRIHSKLSEESAVWKIISKLCRYKDVQIIYAAVFGVIFT